MVRAILLCAMILVFGGAQALAGPCSLWCDLSQLSNPPANFTHKSPPQKSCHDTGSEEDQGGSQEGQCPLQVCADNYREVFYSEIGVSFDQTRFIFTQARAVVKVKFLDPKMTSFIVSGSEPRRPQNPLYILFKNLKLPS